MTVYFIILLYILFVGLLLNNSKTKLHIILVSIPLVLIFSLRSFEVGADTAGYIFGYKYNMGFFRDEPGLDFLSIVFRFLGFTERAYLVIIGLFLIISLGIYIYQYSKNFTMSYVTFFAMYILAYFLNVMRQSIAACIFLFAIKYIQEQKILKYVFLVFVAYLFHSSALILLPIYFLQYFTLTKRRIYVLCGILTALFVFKEGIYSIMILVFPQYSHYINTKYGQGGVNSLVLIETLFITGGCCVIYLLNSKQNPCDKFLLNLSILDTVVVFMQLVIPLASRFSLYTSIAYVVLFPNLISNLKGYKVRVLAYLGVLIILFLRFYIVTIDCGAGIDPFLWWFE